MSIRVLARKWRPKTFADLVGQEPVARTLVNGLNAGRLHHAYLFSGTRGVGKTTLARILAKSFSCEARKTAEPCNECPACLAIDNGNYPDFTEVDAASHTGVENTRDLLTDTQFAPHTGKYKIYLIDEVHMLSNHSFNALLKTLEEPPPHILFLFATTDPRKLPGTVLSRCLKFHLKPISREDITAQLGKILQTEKVKSDAASLRHLAAQAQGSMRDALSLTDQAISYCQDGLNEKEVTEMLGIAGIPSAEILLRYLANNNPKELLATTEHIENTGGNFEDLANRLLEALQSVAVFQTDAVKPTEDEKELADLAGVITPEELQVYYQILLLTKKELPWALSERRALEMGFLRMLSLQPILNEKTKQVPKKVTSESRQHLQPAAKEKESPENKKDEEPAAVQKDGREKEHSSHPAEQKEESNPEELKEPVPAGRKEYSSEALPTDHPTEQKEAGEPAEQKEESNLQDDRGGLGGLKESVPAGRKEGDPEAHPTEHPAGRNEAGEPAERTEPSAGSADGRQNSSGNATQSDMPAEDGFLPLANTDAVKGDFTPTPTDSGSPETLDAPKISETADTDSKAQDKAASEVTEDPAAEQEVHQMETETETTTTTKTDNPQMFSSPADTAAVKGDSIPAPTDSSSPDASETLDATKISGTADADSKAPDKTTTELPAETTGITGKKISEDYISPQGWDGLVRDLDSDLVKGRLQNALYHTRLLSMQHGLWIIGCGANDQKVILSGKEDLAEAISRKIKQSILLETEICHVDETPFLLKSERQKQLVQDTRQDPLVKTLVKDFGGELDEQSVRPLESSASSNEVSK